MSLKVPCKHCGKEISLRKMPNGQFVPFDKWTNTQHRCQDLPPKTASKGNGSGKQQTATASNVSVGNLVMQVVSESPGIKASQIASTISKKHGVQVDRSEVNRWLYGDLKGRAYKNESHLWFPGSAPSSSQRTSPVTTINSTYNYHQGQGNSNESMTEVKSGLANRIQNPAPQQSSNKLLWAIIVLLAVVVLILLNK